MKRSGCRPLILVATMAVVAALGARRASAQKVIDALDTGYYSDGGWHFASTVTTAAGRDPNPPFGYQYYRGFLVFDLSNVTHTVTSAILRTYIQAYTSAISEASQTFTVCDVTNPISVIRASHYADEEELQEGYRIFLDLGEGAEFGTRSVTPADRGHTVDTELTAQGLAAVDAARGGQIALGLRLNMSDVIIYQQWIRFRNVAGDGPYQLVLGEATASDAGISGFSLKQGQATMSVTGLTAAATQEVLWTSNLASTNWSRAFEFVAATSQTNLEWAVSNSWERVFFRVRSK